MPQILSRPRYTRHFPVSIICRLSARGEVINENLDYWLQSEELDLLSAFEALQQLAEEKYGKAYCPLSRLYETSLDDDGKPGVAAG